MKVLITGATGFVGSWLSQKLIHEGHEVSALIRNPNSLGLLEGMDVRLVKGDILDLGSLKSSMQGIETVFHLAGHIGYRRSERPLMEKVNVEGTTNVLNAVAGSSVKRLIHMSSVVAVGASFDGQAPLNEDSPYNLTSRNWGYFETKREAEKRVISAVDSGKVEAVIVNPSTIYGPGDFTKSSRKVQLKVAQGRFRFYTSGGVSVASIEDVVDGLWKACLKGRSGQRYILAGENLRIRDLFALIAKAAHVSAPDKRIPDWIVKTLGHYGDFMERIGSRGPVNSESAEASILYHWFDSSKAVRELGYQMTPAHASVSGSVQWAKERGLI